MFAAKFKDYYRLGAWTRALRLAAEVRMQNNTCFVHHISEVSPTCNFYIYRAKSWKL